MPKQMFSHQRSYKVVAASGVEEREFGRYLGMFPRDAARKAVKQVFKKVPNATSVVISLRETTRWQRRSIVDMHYYVGHRRMNPREVRLPDNTPSVVAKFEYKAVPISKEEFDEFIRKETR